MARNRITIISIFVPFLVWSFGVFWFGPSWMVLGVIAIPIMAIICSGSLLTLEKLLDKYSVLEQSTLIGVLFGIIGGGLIGLAFYFLFFLGVEYTKILAIQYAILGILVGFFATLADLLWRKNAT